MSDYLNPDVQSLIDKVYNEGIERANGQAQQIISDAQQAASGLMEEAKRRIQAMEAEALKEMEHKRNSLDSELKTAAKQVLSNIKNELGETLSTKIVTQGPAKNDLNRITALGPRRCQAGP